MDSTSAFKDHFSIQAESYARFRPDYPKALYDLILRYNSNRNLLWDCATGSGQVATALGPYFKQVIATDASKQQLKFARPLPNIQYRKASAENSGLPDHAIDLITVAQALHWFDIDAFYKEVKRVSKPNSVLAIWGYGLQQIEGPANDIVEDYYYNILKDYWPPERALIDNAYADIPFPFRLVRTPAFFIEKQWNLHQLLGYLYSWSATQRYIQKNDANPLENIRERLLQAWGNTDTPKSFRWPLFVRLSIMD